MSGWLIYFLGWIILSIGYFIYEVYDYKDADVNKKIKAWRSLWIGAFSWAGIIFVIAFLMVIGIYMTNEWIEEKLC